LNNTPNISKETLDQMLNMAGRKMGTDPMKLKEQLEKGAFHEALGKIPPRQSAQINQVLNDPKALEQLLSSPKAQQMLRGLMGGK